MKHAKKAFLASLLSVVLCVTMLVGTTYAWFTDSVTSAGNKIIAGTLDIDLYQYDGSAYAEITDSSAPIFGSGETANAVNAQTLWEPGKTQVAYLKLQNNGSLALKYTVRLLVKNVAKDLYKVMRYVIVPDAQPTSVLSWASVSDSAVSIAATIAQGAMLPVATQAVDVPMEPNSTHYFALVIHMEETAGNEYQAGEVDFDMQVTATQYTSESDSFNNLYDASAEYPAVAYIINSTVGNDDFSGIQANAEDTVITDATATSRVSAGTIIAAANDENGNPLDVSELTDTDSSLQRSISTTTDDDEVTYNISYSYVYTTTTTVGNQSETTVRTADVTSFSDYVVNILDIGKDLKIVNVTHSHGTDVTPMSALTAEQAAAANTEGYYYDHVSGLLTIIAKDYSDFIIKFDKKVAVESVEVDPDAISIQLGDSVNVISTVLPETATYSTVKWTSSDETVATVVNGTVSAVGVGTAVITAEADGKTATCSVVVSLFEGSGTEQDPYLIKDEFDWKKFCDLCRYDASYSETEGKYFVVQSDIDVSDYATLYPSDPNACVEYFAGHIDFTGHTISGFDAVNGDEGSVFVYVGGEDAVIEDITMRTTTIHYSSGTVWAFSLTALLYGNVTIRNATVIGAATGINTNNNGLFAQYVGYGNGGYGATYSYVFENCKNYANLTGNKYTAAFIGAGGFANNGEIIFRGCENYGTIISTGSSASMLISNSVYFDWGNTTRITVDDCANYGVIGGKTAGNSTLLVSPNVEDNVFYTRSAVLNNVSLSANGEYMAIASEQTLINNTLATELTGSQPFVVTTSALTTANNTFVLSETEGATKYELSFSFSSANRNGGGAGYTMVFRDALPENIMVGAWITKSEAEQSGVEIVEHTEYETTYYTCGGNYVYYEENAQFHGASTGVFVSFVAYDENDVAKSIATFVYPQ